MVGKEEVMISEDEAALYDRQIRLWGLDAQKRLRGAKVLLIGLGGLGAEVAKNLTLAGIKSITLLDDRPVAENSANFLVQPSSEGKNVAEASFERVQRLNPMVEVVVDPSNVSTKDDDFFRNYDVVCATGISTEESFRINEACRKHSVPFYTGDTFGFCGFFFVDLLEHEYAEDKTVQVKKDVGSPLKCLKTQETEIRTIKDTLNYIPFKTAWEADYSRLNRKNWRRIQSHVVVTKSMLIFRSQMNRDPEMATRQSDLERLYQIKDHILHDLKLEPQAVDNSVFETTFGELSPTAAVLGGVLAQEIIKAVSHKDLPIRNFFFFNGATDRTGWVEAIGF